MRVYTFQSPNILQLQTKEMSCSQEYWDKDMRIYYDWMYQQYQERIGSNKKSLIWCWDTIPEFYFEYDESEDTYCDNNKEHRYRVLLTLDLPEKRILWSDYNAWHCPLNDVTLLSELELDEEEQGRIFDKMYGWERIFDFEWLNKNGWGR